MNFSVILYFTSKFVFPGDGRLPRMLSAGTWLVRSLCVKQVLGMQETSAGFTDVNNTRGQHKKDHS